MNVHIGDTLSYTDEDGKVTSLPIVSEKERLAAIKTLTSGTPGVTLVKGSYLKDRNAFGPTSHDDKMFEGNVRVGGNAHIAKLTQTN